MIECDPTVIQKHARLLYRRASTIIVAYALLGLLGGGLGAYTLTDETGAALMVAGEMRETIRARMAERDVAVDPATGRLEILRGLVRAHIDSVPESHEEDEDGPVLIVDDLKITWRELGEMLVGLDGWSLRLEILDSDLS